MSWIIWAILGVVVLFGILPSLVLSYVIYASVLVRRRPEKWGRECSFPEDEEYVRMFDAGMAWAAEHAEKKREVSVVSDGLTLRGEYFNFGGDPAVIIIPGRTESLLYSYYFAEPYRAIGMNVLVIDNRSHGLSEGKYVSLGFKEYRDILAWGKLLHDELGNREVVLHGICIGSSVGLFALVDPACPAYFAGLTADGMYVNFYESFRNHMTEKNRPLFPFLYLVMAYIRIFAGANVVTDGPKRRMPQMKKPVLFLHSREDIYSVPEYAQELYDLCPAEKELVWFETGAHSRLRINHQKQYDDAIAAFWAEAKTTATP